MQIPRDSNATLRTVRGKQNSLMEYPYITIFGYFSSYYFMYRNYKTSGGETPMEQASSGEQKMLSRWGQGVKW